jgi:hypothetical protein
MTHADFLELVLADEVTRRESKSASLRARAAGLDASMRLDTWDPAAAVRYDQQDRYRDDRPGRLNATGRTSRPSWRSSRGPAGISSRGGRYCTNA